MQLIPWSHESSEGFTLRGWRSPASGRPLLHFLHGNGFCCLAYQPLLMHLGEHFDLWLSDVQGHGDSDHGGVFRGWNRSAALAVEAFDAGRGEYGDVPRFAVGHSFGGVLTGLILATEPRLFERAVLLDPVLFSRRMIGVMGAAALVGLHRRHALARKAATRRSHWPDREAALASLQGRGIFKGWTDASLHAYVEHAIGECGEGVVLKCRPSREVEIFSSFPERMWTHLTRIQTPTRILYGEHTYPFVPHSVQRLAALNHQVSAQQVAGGHCFMQEDPAAAAEQVMSFLQTR
ncbi:MULTISPECIES: alpha/beta fold hydrolase [Pseudomonas]|uniref:Alpha/beta hydrolase n=1 Tax=Pseudomonas guariconensis TaxID=1288410 RepID=A0AAX0VXP9_9PSED|nr:MULTISPECIES: alpha/beta hydrolase [Pseudomonas]MBH3358031.1 alpha/beta hydrolase [Pseudomonas guariconensis]MCO7622257.1 alpha/beta hydrolase [Pseudomonas guariconensis]MDM9593934.1 alpha/beta hydrolase [Pseudomonas guariconensis]MDM9606761.1 alpha/beta hydrolase [Pseudomonas guariconensis]MDM9611717.1 alpha/beta hydrolase [Pseudomonas guariconensis]